MTPFAKYHGAGNDFIIIDDRRLTFSIEPALIQKLCSRRLGIGADGLLLLQPSEIGDFRMRIFNADGGEPAMCGNGIRCMAHFIHQLGETRPGYDIDVYGKLYRCTIEGNFVSVDMGNISWIHKEYPFEEHVLCTLDTGVPHAVVFVSDLASVDVRNCGRAIRTHFQPDGVNVNFAMRTHEKIHVRTYERGVEDETLACGTGAVAVAAAAKEMFKLSSRVIIMPASQEELVVEIINGQARMSGPVTFVFGGVYDHRHSQRD